MPALLCGRFPSSLSRPLASHTQEAAPGRENRYGRDRVTRSKKLQGRWIGNESPTLDHPPEDTLESRRSSGLCREVLHRHLVRAAGIGSSSEPFAWLNQFRHLRIRYDKRADIQEAFLSLGVRADLLAVPA